MANSGKNIFMRAVAGNINITFQTPEEAKEWKERIAAKLEESKYKVKKN